MRLLSINSLDNGINILHRVGIWQHYKTTIFSNKNLTYSIDELKSYIGVRLNILTSDKRRKFPGKYIQRINRFIDQKKDAIDPKELKVAKCHNDFNQMKSVLEGNPPHSSQRLAMHAHQRLW